MRPFSGQLKIADIAGRVQPLGQFIRVAGRKGDFISQIPDLSGAKYRKIRLLYLSNHLNHLVCNLQFNLLKADGGQFFTGRLHQDI